MPRIEGIDDFEGIGFHPFDWPHGGVELEGKRVAVIGTGATAIQIIPEVAIVLMYREAQAFLASTLDDDFADAERYGIVRAEYRF